MTVTDTTTEHTTSTALSAFPVVLGVDLPRPKGRRSRRRGARNAGIFSDSRAAELRTFAGRELSDR